MTRYRHRNGWTEQGLRAGRPAASGRRNITISHVTGSTCRTATSRLYNVHWTYKSATLSADSQSYKPCYLFISLFLHSNALTGRCPRFQRYLLSILHTSRHLCRWDSRNRARYRRSVCSTHQRQRPPDHHRPQPSRCRDHPFSIPQTTFGVISRDANTRVRTM